MARKRGMATDPARPGRAPSSRRNATAIEATIAALRRAGRLELVDAALVAAARTTAAALDGAPSPYVAGTVARVHVDVVARLLDRPTAVPDALDLFIASLGRPTPDG